LDNFTHTLIGTLVGETCARIAPPCGNGLAPVQRRNLTVAVAAAGSNLPDLDFIYSAVTGDKLGYLLEHRGYTHTVIGALLGAVVMLLACEAWCRWRHWKLSPHDRLQLGGVGLLALLLHIAMDFTNSYGVHPFWPFYNGWLYGDSIFIVEPLLWAAAVPLVVLLRTVAARVLVALVIVAGIAVSFGSGLVPTMFAIVFTVLCAAMLLISYLTPPKTALLAGVGLWIAVTGTFVVARSAATREITALAAEKFQGGRVLDDVLTPMPVNPVCWDAMLVMTQGDRYLIRHATLSITPAVIAAQTCPTRLQDMQLTAPMVAVQVADTASTHWLGEIDMPRDQLAQLAASSCEVSAFMRFARAPFSLRRPDGWLVGDLRYDREPGLGFAEFESAAGSTQCPRHVPPWLPPRGDILE
jgi:inner membrane protein